MPPLPAPDDDALAHSRALQNVIAVEIEKQGGWITFARYMELALYAPGLGYYSGGAHKFGGAGDFVTAPEISALFGQTLARPIAEMLEQTRGDILELGAGSGKLALDLLLALEQSGALPPRYFILEVSADLQQRQRDLLQQHAPHLLPRVTWLARLPQKFSGVILANEVLDALPVHLVVWRQGKIFERGVVTAPEGFAWEDKPLRAGALWDAAQKMSPEARQSAYLSEINLAANALISSLAEMLLEGAMLIIDYGFGQREFYHPQRDRGTLMCHYRHRAHDNPFYLPGLQDITSHVDFSAVAEAAQAGGLNLLGYTTQAHFLINCGITEILAKTSPENPRDYLPLANQLQKLVSPAEMGELFKVIAFGKGVEQMLGFSGGDKSRLL